MNFAINVINLISKVEENKSIPVCFLVLINKKLLMFNGNNCLIDGLKFLIKKNKNLKLFSINLNYEVYFILDFLIKESIAFSVLIFEDNIYEISWNNIKIRSAQNFLPIDLVDLEQKKESFSMTHYFENTESRVNLDSDVKASIRRMELFDKYFSTFCYIIKKDLNLNLTRFLSLSSFSLYSFDKIFNNLNILTHIKTELDELLREGYMGGRNEIYGNTEEEISYFDFPGMYKFCMMEEFPYGESEINKSYPQNLKKKLDKAGFYSIKWKSDNMYIPILPIKSIKNGTIFANGTGVGVYWYEEINLFIESGGIVSEIFWYVTFKKSGQVFKNFIDYFDKFRALGHENKIFSKFIINSLYGKLGFKSKSVSYLLAPDDKTLNRILDSQIVLSISQINNFRIIKIENTQERIDHKNVALAAAITAKGRMKLTRLLLECKKRNIKILACFTDSVFVSKSDIFEFEKITLRWKNYKRGFFVSLKTFGIEGDDSYNTSTSIMIRGKKTNNIDFNEFLETARSCSINLKNNNIWGQGAKRILDLKKTDSTPIILS